MVPFVKPFSHLGNQSLVYGEGAIRGLTGIIPGAGPILFVTGRHFAVSSVWPHLESALKAEGRAYLRETVSGEPSPEIVDALAVAARKRGAEAVIAIGGGSVLDAGKAAAAMLRHEGSVADYLEGVGTKNPTGAAVPMIAVPTTAGTGSEATKNAVISRRGKGGFKKSLRHDNFIPRIALIDPELALGCPEEVSRACALDAFCQLLESFISTGATPVTDALARDGLIRFAGGRRLFGENLFGTDEETALRGELALAAYYSGLTLANAGLGTVHGLAGPLGAICDVPHGAACGLLLAPVFRRIQAASAQEHSAADAVQGRLALAGAILLRGDVRGMQGGQSGRGGYTAASSEGDAEAVLDLFEEWAAPLPRLSHYGLTENDLDAVVAASDNKKSPVALNAAAMREILAEVL